MTHLQKDIIEMLFKGCSIAAYGNGYRLRDSAHNPVCRFSYKTFRPLKRYLRRSKPGLWLLDKRTVRASHGSSWIKKYYNQLKIKPAATGQ